MGFVASVGYPFLGVFPKPPRVALNVCEQCTHVGKDPRACHHRAVSAALLSLRVQFGIACVSLYKTVVLLQAWFSPALSTSHELLYP